MSGAHTGTVWVERRRSEARRCLQAYLTGPMQALLDDPERPFAGATPMKDGNTATVVRVVIGAQSFIVKRYNVKGLWHRLRLTFRHRTRARNAWRFGQLLYDAGIPTARPVALVERRLGPLRDTCYLVMEDLGDRDLLAIVAQAGGAAPAAQWLRAVTELFVALVRLRVSHGDTKASNFLVVRERVALIDLDSMQADVHGHGMVDDLRRFLDNWQDHDVAREAFAVAFRAAGLPRV